MRYSLPLLAFGLLFAQPSPGTLAADDDRVDAAATEALEPIPGDVAFLFTELTDDGPQPLHGEQENERFAVGSTFKLFILGTLAAELNAHRRELANVMRLQPQWIGPPHSELADWPIGSPVTLNTLALKMISISDNTATDHLLHLLGRENIEQQMATMGHAHPRWNRPLLSTREMTMLRDKNTGLPGREYQQLDESAKRKFLAEKTTSPPDYDSLDFDTAAYNLAEWYATPMDMARALAWLKQHTKADQPAYPLRAILAVDPKLPHDPQIWPYVGFKGGSEDQILCGNWLLKNKNGHWYTFHVFCNSPREKLNQDTTIQAIGQVFTAIQQSIDPENPR